MAVLDFTTLSVAPPERFDLWADTCARQYLPCKTTSPFENDFVASVRNVACGSVQISRLRHPPLRSWRSPQLVRSSDPEVLTLLHPASGRTHLVSEGRHASLSGGEGALLSSSHPFNGWHTGDDHTDVLLIEIGRAALKPLHRSLDRLLCTSLDLGQGMGAVLLAHAHAVVEQAESLTAVDRARLEGSTLDLVHGLLAGHLDGRISAPQQTLLQRIKAFVLRELADPELSPRAVAEAQRVSLRYLHRLFEAEDLSVSAWIRAERLERCRRDLADPALAGCPVHAIGAKWGLTDPTYFGRVFREAYGMSPARYRQHHGTLPLDAAVGAVPLRRRPAGL
ncbi:AraC-like ligand-binding domain-containing protein [Actinomadura macrotermitis]|uniref:Transcriptional activator NphR n=1 Tax=Actinomadura macrotermitis TaxID=2585200 RepID=A0A7K0BUI1_9ACTN|nr:helix-turn-helix domain-containing protein [Actinomadura macrotermitis]MQY04542.1 Transcriptional activator NphR [Actinomadura macrotermitis]